MAARKALSSIDMAGKKIINLPAPTAGSTEAARQIDLETAREYARSRANHIGTQTVSTIDGFDAGVRLNRLDQMAAPTTPLIINAQRITGVAEPTAAQDSATKNYVDSSIASLTNGQTFKGPVRALVKTPVNVSAPGSILDNLSPAPNEVYVFGAQATGSENGPWVYNGASTPMSRPANWNTNARAVVGSYWLVTAGSSADTFLILTNDAFTLNTTTAAFKTIDVAATAAAPFGADFGDGSASSFVITHNLNTRDVHVQIRRNASPFDDLTPLAYFEYTSVNAITIGLDEVPSAAQYRVTVAKM